MKSYPFWLLFSEILRKNHSPISKKHLNFWGLTLAKNLTKTCQKIDPCSDQFEYARKSKENIAWIVESRSPSNWSLTFLHTFGRLSTTMLSDYCRWFVAIFNQRLSLSSEEKGSSLGDSNFTWRLLLAFLNWITCRIYLVW